MEEGRSNGLTENGSMISVEWWLHKFLRRQSLWIRGQAHTVANTHWLLIKSMAKALPLSRSNYWIIDFCVELPCKKLYYNFWEKWFFSYT